MVGPGAASAPVPVPISIVDLTSPDLSRELAKIDERIHVLNGLLDALSRSTEVNGAVLISVDRSSALRALQAPPFSYTQKQARAVLEMPVGWQCIEQVETLRKERDQLASQRSSIANRVSEALALHWFG
jgi:DNA gyrase/topoisomerase IV subunit A